MAVLREASSMGFGIPAWTLWHKPERQMTAVSAMNVTMPTKAATRPALSAVLVESYLQWITAVPGVRKVYAEVDANGDTASVWTVIDAESKEQEYQVMHAYGNVLRSFGDVPFYHLMLNTRDYTNDEYLKMIPQTARVVLSR